jgi:autotransporter-associated beta strand protein
MTFSVLNADTGTYAGNYTATGKAYKTGTGTAVFTGSNAFGRLKLTQAQSQLAQQVIWATPLPPYLMALA